MGILVAMEEANPTPPDKPKTGRPKGATNAEKVEIVRAALALLKVHGLSSDGRAKARDRLRRKYKLTAARAMKFVRLAVERIVAAAVEDPADLFRRSIDVLTAIMESTNYRASDRINAAKTINKLLPRKGKTGDGSNRGRVEQLIRDNPELLAEARDWSPPQLTVVEPNEAGGG